MLRSMLSAASAIKNHQVYMDVVANNIANVNTTAYKSMNVTFHELMSQVMQQGATPTAARGGINPIQVGLGMNVGGVSSIFTQGNNKSTGNDNDLAIQGNGFFVFQGLTQQLYSRDGSVDLGLDGSLVNPSTGMRILGWNADEDGLIDTTEALAPIIIPLNQGLAQATQNVDITGNLNAELAARSTSNAQTIASTITGFGTTNPAAGQTELATGQYYVEVRNGPDEFRVVDSSGNPVSIANGGAFNGDWQAIPASSTYDTGRGMTIDFDAGPFTAGTKGAGAASVTFTSQSLTSNIQIYDSLGTLHTLNLTFTKNPTTPNEWSWQVTTDDASITTLTPTTASTFNFTTTGQYSTANAPATLSFVFSNGAANQAVDLDMEQLTQLAQASDLGVPSQDGYAPGQLIGFNIQGDGSVECNYSNGMRQVVAQLAIADFANPGGLLRVGENMFEPASNSGAANVGVAGTGGRGLVQAGYLEGANVDLAQEFTNMISAQRGFQANSRVITASDEMLQELVNLVR